MQDDALGGVLGDSFAALDQFKARFETTFGDTLTGIARRGFGDVARALTETLRSGEKGLASFGETVRASLGRALETSAASIIQSVAIQPLQSGITGLIGGMFGGARAMGGPVAPGQAFLVGERGPELFVPPSAGTIIPSGAKQAAPTVHVTVNAQDANSFLHAKAQVAAALSSAVRQGGRYL